MIHSMAGCKGAYPGDAAVLVASGMQLMHPHEQHPLDVSRNMGPAITVQQTALPSVNDIDVDLREVYFLVMHFLANGPCTRAFGQLWNELLQHKLLPRRYHARYSRDGEPSGDENDDGLSFPLSYRDVASRNPDISNNHLVDLLQQLLVNTSRSASALDVNSKVVTAADTPTLLGTGAFSLLDLERCKGKGVVSRWNKRMRWPHWHADQVHGLMLRELGGGFARHHRAPSVRTASYVIAKPSVFFNRIQIIKKLLGHRNAVYCAIFDRNGQHVITGSDDRLVKIWSTETGLCLRSCRGHEGDITDLAVSSNNELVASASNDFSIRVWRLPGGYPLSVLRGHGGAVTAIAFSPRQGCEHHLLSSSDDGTCRIWDARDSSVNSRVYMPDPKDSQTGPAIRGVASQLPPVPPAGNQILCCSFNADGSIFVTGSSDKIARVWNATKWNDELTGRPNYEMDTLQGHENDVNYVQFSGCAAPTRPLPTEIMKEDNQPRFKNTWSTHDSIVTCSRDGSAIIWTPRPRRHHAKAGRWVKAYHLRVPPPPNPPQPPRPGGPRQRLLPTPRGVNMIVWSLDNHFVLAAIMDCRICVWNAVDGSLVHSLTGHDKQTYVLDVHPFNPRIAMSAGYDGRVIIWDIWDGHPVRTYETGDYNLVDGNFSPDGASVVVSDEVGQIYLFATGEGNSQKDAKYDQFFLGDFRPLVRDTHGNVLDQETQLPPHQRNIQDLLCDASMIPYAEPYQTIYQQRRLGALGIDWQPPTVFLQVGTLEDPTYAAPPDAAVPLQAAVLPVANHGERRTLASEGGNRWVEQPNEVDDAMDWEQEVVGLTEDSGSDYSASEESEDDGEDKADTLGEIDSDEEDEEEEEEDAVSRDVGGLRRSSRNKRKAEVPTFSSSGRRVKRKRYDDGDTEDIGRQRLRHRRVKSSRKTSPSRRASPSRRTTIRQSGKHQPEPSTRPKRQAAKNALHLFSSINDEDEEETEKKVPDHGEKASGSGEQSQRVLRSRNREETDEPPAALPTQLSKVESSDRGELSRRPRSQRKLVVKLRPSAPRIDLEDFKVDASEEQHAETSATDQPINSGADLVEDKAGTSENALTTQAPNRRLRKLVIKHPKPSGGLKRHASVIESSEDNHCNHKIENGVANGNESHANGNESHARRLGPSFDSDDDQIEEYAYRNIPVEEQLSWQWKKGQALKRARGDEHSGDNDSGSSRGASSNEVQEKWKDEISPSGNVKGLRGNVLVDVKELRQEVSEKGNLKCSSETGVPEAKRSFVEACKMLSNGGSYSHHNTSEWHDVPCREEALQNGNPSDKLFGNSEDEMNSPQGRHQSVQREEGEEHKEENTLVSRDKFDLCEETLVPVIVSQELKFHQRHQITGATVLVQETSSQVGFDDVEPVSQNLDHVAEESLGLGQDVSVEDGCVRDLEGSERPMSSHCSGDSGKDSPAYMEDQSKFLCENDPAHLDHETDFLEGGADNDVCNDGGEEVGEWMQQSGSVERESGDDNSGSDLYEDNGVCGRNWDESRDHESDESSDEPNQNKRHTRQRTLGELQPYARQESTSKRQGANLELIGRPRTRQLNAVLYEGVRETRLRAGKSSVVSVEPIEITGRRTRTRTKDIQGPWHDIPAERVLRFRHGRHPDGSSRFGANNSKAARDPQGSTSEQDVQEGSVEFERRRTVSLEKLEENDSKQRRTSGRSRRDDGKREHFLDRWKTSEDNSGLHSKAKKNRSKPGDRKRKDMSWLLLTDVEAGTRYIPQFGDDVVYLRQGHQEFLDSTQSEEKGPWRLMPRVNIRAVEFCRITGLEYAIVPETSQTCCKIAMKFTDKGSRVYGRVFKLTLPELTNFPDFIVERSRYDGAMKKGWSVRDKCQVWWRSDDGVEGRWWDGRIKKLQNKSSEFPGSPWDTIFVLYKLDSSEPTSHSPWELFEPGNHWHDPPHIDDESKAQLLNAMEELEKPCHVGNEDEFGLRCLSQDVNDPAYLNRIPLPLDLGTVKQRLEKDYYHSLEAFRHDIELLVLNAQSYYGSASDMAGKLQRLGQVLQDVMSYDEEPGSSEGDDSDD